MKVWSSGAILRWGVKVLGASGLVLVQSPSAQASVPTEKARLDARVEAARRLLQQQADDEKPAGATRFWVAQWLNWPNWPNWGNWGNWPNWRNF